MTHPFWSTPRNGWRRLAAAACSALLLAGCNETADAPPDEVEIEIDQVVLDSTFPLDDADAGTMMLAMGRVVGLPGPNGFFVEVQGDRVIYVVSDSTVAIGEQLRIVGPLISADSTAFADWSSSLPEPDTLWTVEQNFFIEADSLTRR